jgi:TolB-like protein/Tfp pilus assembly protein PilF
MSSSPRRKWAYLVAGLVMLVVALLLVRIYVLKPVEEPLDSLAVLPLQNLSGDPEQEYFSDGMTEALITELQKIRSLRVISRTSIMRFKKSSEVLPEIARKLSVKVIVEGSVLRDGENVRITVQLIQASPEKHLWAGNFDRPLKNILALQSDVARAIAQEVRVIVTPEEQKEMAASRSVNPESHEAYLKGRFYWNKRTGPDFQKAVEYFDRAIEKDSSYALAYAGIASTYILIPQFVVPSPKEYVSKAETAVRRALQLDPNLAEAHAVLSVIKSDYEWDWAGAESELRRAIVLDPNYPTAHHWYSCLLQYFDRLDEALAEIKQAQNLDPLSPAINTGMGYVLYEMGQYDKAKDQHKQVLDLDPGFMLAHSNLGFVYEVQGKFDEAIEEYWEVRKLVGSSTFGLSDLGRALARSGKRSDALIILDQFLELSRQGSPVSFDIAQIYYGLGDKNKAFEWLEKAYQERSFGLLYLKSDPIWESLRSDPRFIALLKKMRLEP